MAENMKCTAIATCREEPSSLKEGDEVSPNVEDHDETEEEDFQPRYAIHQSQQQAAQITPDSGVATAPLTLDDGPASAPVLSASIAGDTVKVYASEDTDDFLIDALEKHDPLSVTERDKRRSRWQLVALQCRTDSERLFRNGEPYKADYFASCNVIKLRMRWKYLKDKLAVARSRRPVAGAIQYGLSAFMMRVEALVERENSTKAAKAAKRHEEEEKRRNHFHRGVPLAAASMDTVAGESSSVPEEPCASPPLPQWSSQSDSGSSQSPSFSPTRSIRALPLSGARDMIMDRFVDFQAEVADAKEDSRLLQEAVLRLSMTIESHVSAQQLASAELAKSAAEHRKVMMQRMEDRAVIFEAIAELKTTQNMINAETEYLTNFVIQCLVMPVPCAATEKLIDISDDLLHLDTIIRGFVMIVYPRRDAGRSLRSPFDMNASSMGIVIEKLEWAAVGMPGVLVQFCRETGQGKDGRFAAPSCSRLANMRHSTVGQDDKVVSKAATLVLASKFATAVALCRAHLDRCSTYESEYIALFVPCAGTNSPCEHYQPLAGQPLRVPLQQALPVCVYPIYHCAKDPTNRTTVTTKDSHEILVSLWERKSAKQETQAFDARELIIVLGLQKIWQVQSGLQLKKLFFGEASFTFGVLVRPVVKEEACAPYTRPTRSRHPSEVFGITLLQVHVCLEEETSMR
ncbi:hypothetical protein DFQ27_008967 [Actinomortierella ambigua]|uniref:Uncharacterized protein n=1 Tax=Actinomortierella ambigua TaxID=1343610 RepID=A0A9P6PPA6_9FUNG|nr:hypothetical protein DFQ27_008967 [Actinomortierella ambigua]